MTRHDRRRPFVHRSPGPRAAVDPGADGRGAGRRDGRGRVRRGRAGLAAGRRDVAAGAARRGRRRLRRARRPAGQPQFLLPRRRRPPDPAREAAWRDALRPYFEELGVSLSAIQSTGRAGCHSTRRRSTVVEAIAARRGQLPFRAAARAAARARAARGCAGVVFGDHRGRGAAGWRRTASTRSSRRASRPAAIAACSCQQAGRSSWTRNRR